MFVEHHVVYPAPFSAPSLYTQVWHPVVLLLERRCTLFSALSNDVRHGPLLRIVGQQKWIRLLQQTAHSSSLRCSFGGCCCWFRRDDDDDHVPSFVSVVVVLLWIFLALVATRIPADQLPHLATCSCTIVREQLPMRRTNQNTHTRVALLRPHTPTQALNMEECERHHHQQQQPPPHPVLFCLVQVQTTNCASAHGQE